LEQAVAAASNSGNRPSEDVIQASKFPEIRAIGYRAMYANGMHRRIQQRRRRK
jgi:hypothetical protein